MANKKFYAQKDGLGFPIPGTMMSGDRVPTQDNIIEVKEFMGLGNHPQGYKFYVRKNQDGILVNSLFVSFDLQNPAQTIDLHAFPATTTTTTVAPTTTTTTVNVPQE